jgi:hypothetical protein
MHIVGFILFLAIAIITALPDTTFDKWSWLLNGLSSGLFAVFFAWLISGYRERPKIEIFITNSESFYFNWDYSDQYPIGRRLVIWARISNLSSLPNSIMEFDLELTGNLPITSSFYVQPLDEYFFRNGEKADAKTMTSALMVGQLRIKPQVLDPFKSIEGYIFFPSCPEVEGELEGTLIIKTTRGEFSEKVFVGPYLGPPKLT